MRALCLLPMATLAVALTGCIPDVAPRCEGVAPTCGSDGADNCCAPGDQVKGGTFERDNDPAHLATVSDFYLDRYEVTVGRFRQFVAAYPESQPHVGDGAHPGVANSGWQDAWTQHLPADAGALTKSLGCNANFRTWTDEVGSGESLPIDCVDWYLAAAFCAWDGGRLPTEAEWSYAAVGGDQQRSYPWNPPDHPDPEHAVFGCNGTMAGCAFSDLHRVGSTPAGDGRFGQSDLAGSMAEWVADAFAPYPASCEVSDCLALDPAALSRPARGGDWTNDSSSLKLSSTSHDASGKPAAKPEDFIGFRCARGE